MSAAQPAPVGDIDPAGLHNIGGNIYLLTPGDTAFLPADDTAGDVAAMPGTYVILDAIGDAGAPTFTAYAVVVIDPTDPGDTGDGSAPQPTYVPAPFAVGYVVTLDELMGAALPAPVGDINPFGLDKIGGNIYQLTAADGIEGIADTDGTYVILDTSADDAGAPTFTAYAVVEVGEVGGVFVPSPFDTGFAVTLEDLMSAAQPAPVGDIDPAGLHKIGGNIYQLTAEDIVAMGAGDVAPGTFAILDAIGDAGAPTFTAYAVVEDPTPGEDNPSGYVPSPLVVGFNVTLDQLMNAAQPAPVGDIDPGG
jgi:hypothetical protein